MGFWSDACDGAVLGRLSLFQFPFPPFFPSSLLPFFPLLLLHLRLSFSETLCGIRRLIMRATVEHAAQRIEYMYACPGEKGK